MVDKQDGQRWAVGVPLEPVKKNYHKVGHVGSLAADFKGGSGFKG